MNQTSRSNLDRAGAGRHTSWVWSIIAAFLAGWAAVLAFDSNAEAIGLPLGLLIPLLVTLGLKFLVLLLIYYNVIGLSRDTRALFALSLIVLSCMSCTGIELLESRLSSPSSIRGDELLNAWVTFHLFLKDANLVLSFGFAAIGAGIFTSLIKPLAAERQ